MNISKRGRTFTGIVIADKMNKTVTVEWERRKYIPKFERYAKKRTRVKAHNPDEINARTGQMVRIMETRPISKTKNFIVTEILGQGEEFGKEVPKELVTQKAEPKGPKDKPKEAKEKSEVKNESS